MTEREISPRYSHQNAVSEFYSLLKNAYGHGPCFSGIVTRSNFLRISEKKWFPMWPQCFSFPGKKKKKYAMQFTFFFFFPAASMKIVLTFLTLRLWEHRFISFVSQILFARVFHPQCVAAE